MHSPIRKDKTCQNCRHVVQDRFCPNCGQENTETRKTFHHLFIHFFEDLTHYENAFWKTIWYLITKPGLLTRTYLSGKRVSYLAPVRLYIFISFVTFLTISLLPEKEVEKSKTHTTYNFKKPVRSVHGSNKADSLLARKKNEAQFGKDHIKLDGMKLSNVRQLDSAQAALRPEDRMSPFVYKMAHKVAWVAEHRNGNEIRQQIWEGMTHNFPKVLFIYMPMFAFVLWLFHDKRKWFYFDHGIFTLHYFSFLLLGWLFFKAFGWVMDRCPSGAFCSTVDILIGIATIGYMLYYFFPAHHRFYGRSRWRTFFYGIAILWINSIMAGIVMLLFLMYTFLHIR